LTPRQVPRVRVPPGQGCRASRGTQRKTISGRADHGPRPAPGRTAPSARIRLTAVRGRSSIARGRGHFAKAERTATAANGAVGEAERCAGGRTASRSGGPAAAPPSKVDKHGLTPTAAKLPPAPAAQGATYTPATPRPTSHRTQRKPARVRRTRIPSTHGRRPRDGHRRHRNHRVTSPLCRGTADARIGTEGHIGAGTSPQGVRKRANTGGRQCGSSPGPQRARSR